jgi:transposase-like protein
MGRHLLGLRMRLRDCVVGGRMSDSEAKIVELYRAGWLIKNIAAEVGLAPNTTGQILKRLGFERPGKPQRLPGGRPDCSEQIKLLWEEGLCASQIKERLNVTRGIVDNTLTKLGVRVVDHPRHRYDGTGATGGSGRGGFAANMARRT